jgi:RNA polymerase sigma factor (sigma-70 family)
MRPEELADLGDVELADAVRAGHVEAYAVLWERHAAAGRAAARRLTSTYDPDDLLQEAYLRILRSLQLGSGPTGPFRAYLYTTVRGVAATWSRTPAPVPVDEVPDVVDETDVSTAVLERSTTVKAFRQLPERWRSVLWYTEVEGMGAREAGTMLGLSAQATAALAYRAREGLRRAWVQAHVSADGVAPGCSWTVEHLGDHARGTLPRTLHDRVEEHLAGCASCAVLAEEVDDVASRLRLVLTPLVLGVPATLGTLAPTGAASASTASVSTMSGSATTATTASASATSAASSVSVTAAATVSASAVGSASATAVAASVSTLVAAAVAPGVLVAGIVAVAVAVGVGVAVVAQPWEAPEAPPAVVATDVDGSGGAGAGGLPTPASAAPGDETPVADDTGGPVVGSPPTSDEDGLADEDPPAAPDRPPTTSSAPAPGPAEPDARPDPAEPSGPDPEPVDPGLTNPSEPPETPEPEPSAPPGATEAAPVVVTTAPAPGTLTVFPLVRGTGEPGALVQLTDAQGDVVASTTVGEDGTWEATPTTSEASGEHTLEVVQEVAGAASTSPARLGPYVFDLPRVLSPAPGAVVVGTLVSRPWQPPRLTTDVVLGGTPGLVVEAFVDGRSTGHLHTLGDEPLVRRIPDLAPGPHSFGLRVVEPGAEGPGHGPTVTVPFTLVVP